MAATRGFAIAMAACLAMLYASQGLAADRNGDYVVKGAGFETCQSFLASEKARDAKQIAFRGWINGYLTAYNLMSANTYDIAPLHSIDGLVLLVGRICAQQPPATKFAVVVGGLPKLLSAYALTMKSPAVEAKAGDRTIRLPAELLLRAQTKLKAKKLYTGAPDGQFGPGTQAAISKYQKSKSLEATGLPDPATLLHLLAEAP